MQAVLVIGVLLQIVLQSVPDTARVAPRANQLRSVDRGETCRRGCMFHHPRDLDCPSGLPHRASRWHG